MAKQIFDIDFCLHYKNIQSMRRFIYLILMLLMLSVSCTDDSCRYEVLDRADSIMSVNADSALNILNRCLTVCPQLLMQ